VRRTLARLSYGVLTGVVGTKEANAAVFAITSARAALELEVAEQLSQRLAELRDGSMIPPAREVVEHLPSVGPRVVIEAEVTP
jgi:hypothetical protein